MVSHQIVSENSNFDIEMPDNPHRCETFWLGVSHGSSGDSGKMDLDGSLTEHQFF